MSTQASEWRRLAAEPYQTKRRILSQLAQCPRKETEWLPLIRRLSCCFAVVVKGCLSVCLFVCLSLSVCLSVSLSLSLAACLPVCLSVCLPSCLSVCLSVCLSLSLSLSLSLFLSLSLSLRYTSMLLDVKQQTNKLSLCLSVCLSLSLILFFFFLFIYCFLLLFCFLFLFSFFSLFFCCCFFFLGGGPFSEMEGRGGKVGGAGELKGREKWRARRRRELVHRGFAKLNQQQGVHDVAASKLCCFSSCQVRSASQFCQLRRLFMRIRNALYSRTLDHLSCLLQQAIILPFCGPLLPEPKN